MKKVRRNLLSKSKSAKVTLHRQLIMAVALSLLLALSCSEDEKGGSPTGPRINSVDNNLVFKYQSGREIQMGSDYAICCGIWEPGYIDKNALKIFFYDPSFQQSFWKLFIVVDELTVDSTYSLPTNGSPVSMFFVDFSNSNELYSHEPESSGSITVYSLDCGPPVKLVFSIDATVGSEYAGMPSVDVSGYFSCAIYSNPAPFGCDFSM
ncbi:MAG: hypothetical protein GTO42_01070 [Candidatus Latescibacteria bacterium]|nr:hypothetical protein [Candidatus Latescibacterota bacterium]NIO27120.1 hypothetical protein [Candidatus Latescibacterota bacterium]NIO54644.1 hypothetical protein [Candidatus Latescibacterota bacterium]NIT00727.1 hypothetical protein [Candidatus Latescibacterota bacterium]NIT37650.1 hypothetical protein [Candidatus Latescibacterota bacterium]